MSHRPPSAPHNGAASTVRRGGWIAHSPARLPLFFSPLRRNKVLAGKGAKIPRAKKTGTTIVGVVYADGVVLGADTRATEGDTVADKNCDKIHYIAVRPAPPPAASLAADTWRSPDVCVRVSR